MHNILLDILEKKKLDLEEQKKNMSLEEIKEKALQMIKTDSLFKESILSSKDIALIAEIKLASPTIQSLGSEDEFLEKAEQYEKYGATAISVVTEKYYFKGDTEFVTRLKKKIQLPVLQKDFIIDEYQIYEAKAIGSDAVLLIARYLDNETLKTFVTIALELAVESIVEINNEEDLEKALLSDTNIIAVNARNLENFSVDVEKACMLMKKIPKKFITLGFSGIHSSAEVTQYKNAGAKGVLVGTDLMRARNIGEFMKSLRL